MKSRFGRIGLGVALAATAWFAQAASQSSAVAELTAIRVQVVDLTPDDGIAPSFNTNAEGRFFPGFEVYAFSLTAAQPLAHLSDEDGILSFNIPSASGKVEYSPGRIFTAVAADVGVWTTGHTSWETSSTWTPTPQGGLLTGQFTMGAGTAVVISADYRQSVSVAAGADGTASSWVALYGFVGSAALDPFPLGDGRYLTTRVSQLGDSGTLSFQLSNPSANAMPAYFGASTQVSALVTAVPEPSTLALLVAGSMLLGVRLRMAPRRS